MLIENKYLITAVNKETVTVYECFVNHVSSNIQSDAVLFKRYGIGSIYSIFTLNHRINDAGNESVFHQLFAEIDPDADGVRIIVFSLGRKD